MSTRFEARPQRTLAESMIKKSLEEGTYNADQIAKDTGYTPQHINRLAKKVKTFITPLPKEAPQEKEGEEKPIEKIEVTPPAKLKEIQTEELPTREEVEGFINSRQITQLFQSVNQMIPKKYQRPNESMELLGNVWSKPLNRLLERYENENYDLIIATVTTVIVFSPVAVEYMRDKRQQPKTIEVKTP